METAQQVTTKDYGSGHEHVDTYSVVTDVEIILDETYYLDGDNCDTADEANGGFRKSVHFFIDNFSNFYESGLVGVWMRSDSCWTGGDELRDEDGNFIFSSSQSHQGPKVVLTQDSVKKLIQALASAARLKVEIER